MPLCQQVADGEQFVSFRHIDAREHEKLLCREMKVEARPGSLAEILKIERCCNVCLVRTFVLGKTRVAINAEYRLLREGYVSRSEFCKLGVDCVNQGLEWATNLFFIDVLARLKPLTLVMALESSKKCDCFWGEAGKAAFYSWLSVYGEGGCWARHADGILFHLHVNLICVRHRKSGFITKKSEAPGGAPGASFILRHS